MSDTLFYYAKIITVNFLVYFLFISFETSLIHMLCRSVLFCLQIFWDFPVIFLLLVYNLIQLWAENILGFLLYFYYFKLLRYVLWPRMWSRLVNVPHELVPCSVVTEWSILCQLDPIDWWYSLGQLYSYWFYDFLIYQLLDRNSEVSSQNSKSLFLIAVLLVLPHVFMILCC